MGCSTCGGRTYKGVRAHRKAAAPVVHKVKLSPPPPVAAAQPVVESQPARKPKFGYKLRRV